jgi:hypothetical protein
MVSNLKNPPYAAMPPFPLHDVASASMHKARVVALERCEMKGRWRESWWCWSVYE